MGGSSKKTRRALSPTAKQTASAFGTSKKARAKKFPRKFKKFKKFRRVVFLGTFLGNDKKVLEFCSFFLRIFSKKSDAIPQKVSKK